MGESPSGTVARAGGPDRGPICPLWIPSSPPWQHQGTMVPQASWTWCWPLSSLQPFFIADGRSEKLLNQKKGVNEAHPLQLLASRFDLL